ncbi:membrane dipeptidase [bacterium]|nr:membrane dipeptidase [bacterium]
MIVVDGHLDLAFNKLGTGRDPRESALAVREREGEAADRPFLGRCMVGLPQMRSARTAVVFPTIFLARKRDKLPIERPEPVTYETAEEAERAGLRQFDFYRELTEQEDSGFRMIGTRADLDAVVAAWEAAPGAGDADGAPDVGFVPLMEGADPIRVPEDAAAWFERGVRIVGLSWRSTRYAGGTSEPGPLTKLGRRLVPELARVGLILDLSHAAEESFFEALDLTDGPVMASHSNPRHVCDTDRQLSDEMIRRIARRDGVIGAVPFNMMLVEKWRDSGSPRVPLRRFAEAIHHTAQVAGTHTVAAIGSDFDGGFGAESAPDGLDTIADLPRVAEALADLGFTDGQIRDILAGNWLRFLRKHLPGG